jgi:hypothetical protein
MGVSNMLRKDRWMASALVTAGLAVSGLGGGTSLAAETARPAKLEQIPGSDLKRVVLTPKAAERLAIETAPVREEPVMRWLMVGGEIEPKTVEPGLMPAAGSGAAGAADAVPLRVRVPLLDDPSRMVGNAFLILSLGDSTKDEETDQADDDDDDDDDDEEEGKSRPMAVLLAPVEARPVETAPDAPIKAAARSQYFEVNRAGLLPGQRVYVRVPQPGSGTPQKVIPYSAVIYDPHGNTWTYTNAEPLVFVRHRIDVEYVENDLAVLREGPAVGTAVVTIGAAELMGVEQKVGN